MSRKFTAKVKKGSKAADPNIRKRRNDPSRVSIDEREKKIRYIRKVKREAKLKEERRIRKARKCPKAFAEYVMKDDSKETMEFFGRAQHIKLAPFQEDFIDHFEDNDRGVSVIPREHGKTTILISEILFHIGKNQNLIVKLVCNSDDNAKKRLHKIEQYIRNDPDYHRVFPDVQPHDEASWSKKSITIKRDVVSTEPTIEACAILSSGTGGRADILFVDDPVDHRNAILNPSTQKQVIQAFFTVWMNLLKDGGKVWYIATLWTKADLSHVVMEKKNFKVLEIPVGENFQTIWPEHWPRERLIERCEDIGQIEYDRNFRHMVVSESDRLFTDETIKRMQKPKIFITDTPHNWPKFAGVDLAISHETDASRTVIYTLALNPKTRVRRVMDIKAGRWTSPRQAKEIWEQYKKWKHQRVMVEVNGYQQALVDWMKQSGYGSIPIRSFFTTGHNKLSIDAGINSLSVEMENGNWEVPFADHDQSGMIDCQCKFHRWFNELRYYPRGSSTDFVMAGWLAREAARSTLGSQMIRVVDLKAKDPGDFKTTSGQSESLRFIQRRYEEDLFSDDDDDDSVIQRLRI